MLLLGSQTLCGVLPSRCELSDLARAHSHSFSHEKRSKCGGGGDTVGRTKAFLDQSLKSYKLELRFSRPNLRDPALSPLQSCDHCGNILDNSRLELSTYYKASESGLQPQTVIHKVVSNLFRVFASSEAPEEAHPECSKLFIPRKDMRSKYQRVTDPVMKSMKIKEYVAQILLRLEAANQAVKYAVGTEETIVTKAHLKEIRNLLADIMFQLPGKVVGAGVKEFLDTVVQPTYNGALQKSVKDLYRSFGLHYEERKTSVKVGPVRKGKTLRTNNRRKSSKTDAGRQVVGNARKAGCADREEKLDLSAPGTQAGNFSSLMRNRSNLRKHTMNLMRKVCIKIRTKPCSKSAASGRPRHAPLSEMYTNTSKEVVEQTPAGKLQKKRARVVMETPFQAQRLEENVQDASAAPHSQRSLYRSLF